MKKIILIFICLGLFNCASSSKNSSVKETPSSNSSSKNEAESSEDVSAESDVEKAPVIVVPDSQYAGLITAIKSQNDDAISKAAMRILLQAPNDVKALNALALVNYKKGRYDAAQYLLSKALAKSGNVSETHSNLGLFFLAKKEKRDAIRSFKKALEINPQDGVAAANLGSIYVQEKDMIKAVFALEIAYGRGVRDIKTMNNYAVALASNGKTAEAGRIYKTLVKDNASNKEVLFNYIVFLVDHEQNYKEGIEYINRLKFVGVPPEVRQKLSALEAKAKSAK